MGHNFSLDTGYLNYGQNFHPPVGAAEADIAMADAIYPGNSNGWLVNVSYDLAQGWNLYGIYYSGNQTGGPVGSGSGQTEYEAGVSYKFAPGAKLTLKIRDLKVANIEQFLLYRAQVDYSF
jgi:predicted porin